jgi:hypothetical protein
MQFSRVAHPSTTYRRVLAVASVGLVMILAACSTPEPQSLKNAQSYVQQANLKQLDLPAGWSAQSTPSGSATPAAASLSDSQLKIVDGIMSSLPGECQVLKGTFIASLESSPPPGTVAQNVAQYSSAADGNATISSTVAVFGTLSKAQATYALYSASTFPSCLQGFLSRVLPAMFNETVRQEAIVSVPTPALPAGINGIAFSVATQAAPGKNAQTRVSVSQEVVMQSGRALSFVEEQSETTALPVDTQTVFDQSVATVAHRLVHPPT